LSTGTTFTVRYAAPAIIGFAVLLAYLANGHRLLARYGTLLLVVALVGRFAQATRSDFRRAAEDRAAMNREFLALEGLDDAPVVIADPFTFLKLFHYAPDSLRSRMVHLNSPPSLRADSREWALNQLKKWAHLPVHDCRAFVSLRRDVWVSGANPWLAAALTDNGLIGQTLSPAAGIRLYSGGPTDSVQKLTVAAGQ
jgi:hypothetical protein